MMISFLTIHIISQIRRGFRSRIFFELKNLFHPAQSVLSEVQSCILRTEAMRLIYSRKITSQIQFHQTRTTSNPCH